MHKYHNKKMSWIRKMRSSADRNKRRRVSKYKITKKNIVWQNRSLAWRLIPSNKLKRKKWNLMKLYSKKPIKWNNNRENMKKLCANIKARRMKDTNKWVKSMKLKFWTKKISLSVYKINLMLKKKVSI